MGKHETITAEISDAMASSIREAVNSGDYDSAEEVVRHALTEWRIAASGRRIGQAQLTSMLEVGLKGVGIPAEDVFDRLQAKYAAMAEAKDGRR